MRRGTRFGFSVTVAIVVALIVPALAAALSIIIYVNSGVAGATLGMRDSTAAKKIGKVVKSGRDSSYEGQTVYYFYFGTKSGGKYPIEMYSNSRHKVFTFVVNSYKYRTLKGVRVGTSEAALKKAYPGLKRHPGPVYIRYSLGTRTGTDFYVKSQRVQRIVVRTY